MKLPQRFYPCPGVLLLQFSLPESLIDHTLSSHTKDSLCVSLSNIWSHLIVWWKFKLVRNLIVDILIGNIYDFLWWGLYGWFHHWQTSSTFINRILRAIKVFAFIGIFKTKVNHSLWLFILGLFILIIWVNTFIFWFFIFIFVLRDLFRIGSPSLFWLGFFFLSLLRLLFNFFFTATCLIIDKLLLCHWEQTQNSSFLSSSLDLWMRYSLHCSATIRWLIIK